MLGDQVSRARFTAYAIVPELAPRLEAAPALGKRYDLDDFSLTLPARWELATRGVPGEAARFETATDTLVVERAIGAALNTADSYADQVLRTEQRGYENVRTERTIESVLQIFRGKGVAGDTTGNSPGTKWVAFNAIAEHLDHGRR